MIAYILDSFPSATEWFISNEIISLRQRGLSIVVLALNRGRMQGDATVLYRRPAVATAIAHLFVLVAKPAGYFKALAELWQKASIGKPLRSLKALRNFSIAVDFLYRLRKLPVQHIHAHFITMPAAIASNMNKISGIPFSASAHARDIYTSDPRHILSLFSKARFIVTCTKYNKSYLDKLTGAQARIHHIYHGIDCHLWPLRKDHKPFDKDHIKIVSVGRLVEKKRYDLPA